MIELKDTVELMLSDDWRKRLVGEYAQAVIRWKENPRLIDRVEDLQVDIFRAFDFETITKIRDWILFGGLLTVFEEPQEPIKLKGNDNEVQWSECGGGRGWLCQIGRDFKWGLESPICDSYEEAVKAWNKMVSRMNGDE